MDCSLFAGRRHSLYKQKTLFVRTIRLLETVLTKESAFRDYLPEARDQAAIRERLAKLGDRIRAVMTSPSFAIDVLNLQRDLARPRADYGFPAHIPPAWYSVARRAQVVRRDQGFAVVFDGGEIQVGAAYPTVEWMLKQRTFSVDDALNRQTGIDRDTLLGDIERLARAGIIVETEMR
ncbi:MAG TPA: hypothetical protein VMM36_18485 [Opitutaceae bacterium]|nr:hypothetical protein [Opitutaceae bacterium]